MSDARGVTITLTSAQTARVVREAAGGAGFAALMASVGDLKDLERVLLPLLSDEGFSRSMCRALLVLSAVPSDGTGAAITAIASKLGLSASTTHRYARTWVALGVLEQDAASRRYHRPTPTDERVGRNQMTRECKHEQ